MCVSECCIGAACRRVSAADEGRFDGDTLIRISMTLDEQDERDAGNEKQNGDQGATKGRQLCIQLRA